MNWSIDTASISFSTEPTVLWVIIAFAAAALAFRLYRSLSGMGGLEISGKIDRICRNNVIQLDVGEVDKVDVGQVFTVYKRLCLSRVNPSTGAKEVSKVDYRPVARAKVISTTRRQALCKYRPIEGYSSAPNVGDTVFYSSRRATSRALHQASA